MAEDRSMLHSLTRLVMGGLVNSYDGLRSRLDVWETHRDTLATEAARGKTGVPGPAADEVGGRQPPGSPDLAVTPLTESERDRLRFALIGAIFTAQEQAGRGLRQAGRASRLVGNLAELLVGPVYNSRLLEPLRNQVDALAERGQQEVERWIDLGRYEDEAGRELARAAVSEQVDNAIEYLTANDEVQELVQSQSAGLVDEVIEEARERTVSADNFLESLVRSFLRRPQRWELPDPPAAIKNQAAAPRQVPGKVLKR